MKAKQLIGKVCRHSTMGRVRVDHLVPGSRTVVVATVIDRGAGWDETSKTYKGVKLTRKDELGAVGASAWSRSQNRDHGTRHEVHVDALELLGDEEQIEI